MSAYHRPRGAPAGQSAVMATRKSGVDSLDFFPTPPWGTRAFAIHVLPHLGVRDLGVVAEPCCGEGHMAAVLEEFTDRPVIASDVFDYGYGVAGADYLNLLEPPVARSPDWTITNPPFVTALDITLRALELSRSGVAMLLRTAWVEGETRYLTLFRDRPPTLIAPYVERLPMTEFRWDPDASSATSYSWFVWVTGREPMPPFWIPPGCRVTLTRPEDRERFAAWSLEPIDLPMFPVPPRSLPEAAKA